MVFLFELYIISFHTQSEKECYRLKNQIDVWGLKDDIVQDLTGKTYSYPHQIMNTSIFLSYS